MTKRKHTGKIYEIDSFEKLCNVISSENFEDITLDLILWLDFHVKTFEAYRSKHPEDAKKTNWEISQTCFIWVDDGKREMKKVLIKNTRTGEVSTIKIKKK